MDGAAVARDPPCDTPAMRHRRAGGPAVLIVGLLVTGPVAAFLGVIPAGAETVPFTDQEVCDLIPAYEGGYGPGSHEPGGNPHGYSIASCSYEVFLQPGVLFVHVQLFGRWGTPPPSEETARNAFDVEAQGLAARWGSAGEPLDIGDAARHWSEGEDHTLALVGPFVIHAWGQEADTVAAAREVAAAAAALAPGTATTTTSTTTSATTVTPASTTTEPPMEPDEPELASCAPQGTVTDQAGAPMPGLRVRLLLSGEVADQRVTDGDGWYQFADLEFLAEAYEFDPAEDGYVVAVVLQDAVEGAARFEVRYGPQGVLPEVRRGPLTVEADPTCRVDFAFADIGDEYSVAAGPASADEWRSLALAYQSIRKAHAFAADSLGTPLTMTPLPVYMFCRGSPPGVHGRECLDTAFWQGSYSYDETQQGQPFLAFPVSDSLAWNARWRPLNAEYHEFGHALMADAFGGYMPSMPGLANHAGYRNAASTDSWTEGFAEWFATQVARHADGAPRWWLYPGPVEVINLEDNRLVTGNQGKDEELAIAGILVDMVDGDADYAAPAWRQLTVVRYANRVDAGHPAGGAVAVDIRNDTGVAQSSIAVSGDFGEGGGLLATRVAGFIEPDTLPPGATGRAYIPYREGFGWADLRGVRVVGLGSGDDDGVTRTAAEVWQAILAYRSTSEYSKGHVMNTAELYQALRSAFPADLAAIDGIFVAHGVYADMAPRNSAHDPGEPIGTTSPDGSRLRADYLAPEVFQAAIDTAGVPARVQVQVLYPQPRDGLSYAYSTTPDPETGTISVAVPPVGTGALVRMVVWADGHLPALLPDLYAEGFWAQAEANEYRPFLDYQVSLPVGDVMTDAVATDADGTPAGGAGFLLPLLVALAAVAVAAGGLWWGRRRAAAAGVGGVGLPAPGPAPSDGPARLGTHSVPASGLPGWGEPDGSTPEVAAFAGGAVLEVVERRADWALVRSADGTEAWVDGRRLASVAEIPPPPPPPDEDAVLAPGAVASASAVPARSGVVLLLAAAMAVSAFLPWRANWEPSAFNTSATFLWNVEADVGWFSIGLVFLLLGLAALSTLFVGRLCRYRRALGGIAAGLALLWLVETARYLVWFDVWPRLGAMFTQEFAAGPWLALAAGLVLLLKRR